MAVGRISGPLLKANLERNGVDLDFRNNPSDTPLLFFDVSTNKLGIKVDAPSSELHISQDAINTTVGPTFSVNSEENNPRGITFNNDGTKMFITGPAGDDVNEYTLSVGFDLSSTVTFIDSYAVTECPNPTAVKFNADGTKMFVTGVSNNNVHEYALTTGFDVSTASFTQTLVTTVDNDNFGLDFSTDGTKMYITGNQNDKIYEYNLASAFNISTATYNQDLYLFPYDDEPFGIEWSTDGYRLFIVGTRGNGVDEYKLTSAWNISTATHVGYYHIGGNPSGIHISPDGTKMFIVGNSGDQVKEFNLSVSYRVATPSAGGDATLKTTHLINNTVYSGSSSSATLTHTINNPDIATNQVGYDYFGKSVSIDGNYALIGSSEDRIDGTIVSTDGVAYLFNVSTGAKILHILNPVADSSANFSSSLDLDSTNDRMVIGCSGYDEGSNNNSGRAYIFDLSGTLLHTLSNPNAQTNTKHYDQFGVSVAIDSGYCIVGADSEDVGTTGSNFWNSGSAYIFNVSTGSLVHTLANPNAYGTSQYDKFGCAVDIDGNNAIVGASGEDSASENNVGKAYIFNVSTGALVHTLNNPNPFSGSSALDRFGSSVAIKGNYAIVGAAEEYNAAGILRAGAAYIFDVSTGNLLHTLANPTTDQAEWFGFSVDISTDYSVVGAYNYDGTNTDEGILHVFSNSTGALIKTINNPNPENDAEYGRCSIDGTNILSSAWKNNTGGTNDGQAYIHELSFTPSSIVPVPIANFYIKGSNINVSTGNILFNAAEAIRASTIETDNIRITDNTISTFNSNASFDITPNGTGRVEAYSDMKVFGNLDTPQTVTMGGSITIGDNGSDTIDFNTDFTSDLTPDITNVSNLGSSINKWNNLQTFRLNGSKLDTPNLKIETNYITTQISNSNLDLRGNASGNVLLDDFTLSNETISSATDITIGADTTMDTTAAMIIPTGTTAQRTSLNAGIRFNTTSSQFEGYYSGNTIFGGVYSDNSLTNVVAHPTNNTIGFTINNTSVGTVNASGITIHGLQVDDINIDGSVISTSTDTDLVFAPAGTGASKAVKIDNISIGETIGNQQIKSDNNIIEFATTGYGANKFPGSYAVTIPSGDTASRPVSPQLGDTRWNTENSLLETYNGSNYISAAGSGGVVTRAEYDDILLQYTILLG